MFVAINECRVKSECGGGEGLEERTVEWMLCADEEKKCSWSGAEAVFYASSSVERPQRPSIACSPTCPPAHRHRPSHSATEPE